MKSGKALPQARTEDLVVQELMEETLVYDKRHHHAHCLNPLAALVLRHCNGHTSQAEMAAILNKTLGVPGDLELVELALQELAQADLLRERAPASPGQMKYSRREVARRVGAGAAALLLAPMVTSIMTQSAMAQASPPTGTTAAGTTTTTTTTTGQPPG